MFKKTIDKIIAVLVLVIFATIGLAIAVEAAQAGVVIKSTYSKSLFDRVADAEAAQAEGKTYHGINKDSSENCKTPKHLWGCKYLKEGAVLPMVVNGRVLYNASKRGMFIEELAHQNGVTVEEFKQYMLDNSNRDDIPPVQLVKKEIELIQGAIQHFLKLQSVGFTEAQYAALLALHEKYADVSVEFTNDAVKFSVGDVDIALEKKANK